MYIDHLDHLALTHEQNAMQDELETLTDSLAAQCSRRAGPEDEVSFVQSRCCWSARGGVVVAVAELRRDRAGAQLGTRAGRKLVPDTVSGQLQS